MHSQSPLSGATNFAEVEPLIFRPGGAAVRFVPHFVFSGATNFAEAALEVIYVSGTQ